MIAVGSWFVSLSAGNWQVGVVVLGALAASFLAIMWAIDKLDRRAELDRFLREILNPRRGPPET